MRISSFDTQGREEDELRDAGALETIKAFCDKWRHRIGREAWEAGYEEGWKKGYKEGWRDVYRDDRQRAQQGALTLVYQARFGTLPPALRAAIENQEEEILRRWVPPFATRTPDEIAALVHGRTR